MKISVFGLGYVGAVTGACMAKEGHEVIGVDPDPKKLELIGSGKSPIVEEGLDDLMAMVVGKGAFRVTSDYVAAVGESDLSLICVGTPSKPSGALNTDYVQRVSEQIGSAARTKGGRHSVVVRSTVLPGTSAEVVRPALEKGFGGPIGEYIGLSMNPEFLREGTSIADYYSPPFTVIGTDSSEEFEKVKSLYVNVPGEMIHCSLECAEAIKYGCNIFHALKITFANEMGTLCKALGVDSIEVLDILCRDTKLNISTKYMRPGFAFGGSCLPKDLRGYTYRSRSLDLPLPMFEGAIASNHLQIERVANRITQMGSRKVALLGLSFKEGTDDLRESPLVTLAEILIGKGFELCVFDPNVEYASLYGSNKEYIDKELPHLKKILVSAEDAFARSDILVFGHSSSVYRELIPNVEPRHAVFDLCRIASSAEFPCRYEGLYW